MLSIRNVWKNILLYQHLWEHQKLGMITQVPTLVPTSTQKPLLVDCSWWYILVSKTAKTVKKKLGQNRVIFLLLLLLKEP